MVLILSASSPPNTLLASRAETSNLCDICKTYQHAYANEYEYEYEGQQHIMCQCSSAQLVGPIATDYMGMNVRMKCEYEM